MTVLKPTTSPLLALTTPTLLSGSVVMPSWNVLHIYTELPPMRGDLAQWQPSRSFSQTKLPFRHFCVRLFCQFPRLISPSFASPSPIILACACLLFVGHLQTDSDVLSSPHLTTGAFAEPRPPARLVKSYSTSKNEQALVTRFDCHVYGPMTA